MRFLLSRLRSLALRTLLALAATAATSTTALAFDCPSTQVKDGALCYAKPRAGYSCHATTCVANCPEGYHSSGIATCHYSGTLTYTQKPYVTRSHSGMQRCLALFYNDCRSGYRMDVCGICAYGGKWDTIRHSYDRGPGSNPDANAAFRRISDTTRNAWSATLQGTEAGFNDAVAALTQFEADVLGLLTGVVKTTAQQAVGKSTCFVNGVHAHLLQGVTNNRETLNVVKRVLVDAANRKGSEQTRADMRAIVQSLNLSALLTSCGDVPEAFKKPYTMAIFTGYEVSAGAGVTGAVGLMVTIDPKGPTGTFPSTEIRAFTSRGNAFGPAFGSDFEIGISLQPGTAASQNGKYMGFSATVTDEAGGTLAVYFDQPKKFPPDVPAYLFNLGDPQAAVKDWLAEMLKNLDASISIAATTGARGSFSLEMGAQTTYLLLK